MTTWQLWRYQKLSHLFKRAQTPKCGHCEINAQNVLHHRSRILSNTSNTRDTFLSGPAFHCCISSGATAFHTDLNVCSVDNAHPVGPDLSGGAVRQVVEVGMYVSSAEYVRQLFGRTREAAVATDLVQRVAICVLVLPFADQVTLA